MKEWCTRSIASYSIIEFTYSIAQSTAESEERERGKESERVSHTLERCEQSK